MDLGYHLDQTSTIFKEAGFSSTSYEVAGFANALTDLIGNFMSVIGAPVDGLGATRLVHADNLFTSKHCHTFWHLFRRNIQTECGRIKSEFEAAAGDAARRKATEELLSLIGICFHATQDFCSHSNWVAKMDNPDTRAVDEGPDQFVKEYQRATPLSNPNLLKDKGIVTGWYEYLKAYEGWVSPAESLTKETQFHDTPPGNKPEELENVDWKKATAGKQGIHLDAQHRRNDVDGRVCFWDEAYVTAYLSCKELLEEIRIASGPVYEACKTFEYDEESTKSLKRLMHQVTFVFMWIQMGHHNGHWKGPGSGDLLSLIGNVGLRGIGEAVLWWKAPGLQVVRVFEKLMELLNGTDRTLLMATFRKLVAESDLVKDLYKTASLVEPDNVAISPANITDLKLSKKTITLRVKTLECTQSIFDAQRAPNHLPPLKDLDVFLKVEFQELDGTGNLIRSQEYRERTFQNVGRVLEGNDLKYILPAPLSLDPDRELQGTPWEVIHFFGLESGPEVKQIRIKIRLFDEDTLLSLGDDEIKISAATSNGDEEYGIQFTIDLGTGAGDRTIVDEQGTSGLTGQSIADADGLPVTLPRAVGGTKNWFFRPELAEITFDVRIATIV